MKIVVIESSPHKHGASNLLSDNFIRGAKEKGHQVTVFDAARAELHHCLGCDVCGMSGPCCQKDDMAVLRNQILESDMMVFVTPLYYFGFSAQLKRIKTALIVAAWDSNDWTMREIKSHYDTLCRYLNFKDQGRILGVGCGTVSMTERSEFPERAYQLGRSL